MRLGHPGSAARGGSSRSGAGGSGGRFIAAAVVLGALVLPAAAGRTAELGAAVQPVGDWGQLEVALTQQSSPRPFLLFALFSSGRAFYVAPGDYRFEQYRFVTLTPAERQALVGDLALARVGALHTPVREGDDGGTDCIHVWSAGRHAQDCIWGGMNDDCFAGEPKIPVEMVKIWQRLERFTSPRARRWLPPKVDVFAHPWCVGQSCNLQCGTPRAELWPPGWPRPNQRQTAQLEHGEWHFTLPGTALPQLQEFRSRPQVMWCARPMVFGRSWVELDYSVPLPGQEAWRDSSLDCSRYSRPRPQPSGR
jgi:hypothetical protein